jgi:hypothetical protein
VHVTCLSATTQVGGLFGGSVVCRSRCNRVAHSCSKRCVLVSWSALSKSSSARKARGWTCWRGRDSLIYCILRLGTTFSNKTTTALFLFVAAHSIVRRRVAVASLLFHFLRLLTIVTHGSVHPFPFSFETSLTPMFARNGSDATYAQHSPIPDWQLCLSTRLTRVATQVFDPHNSLWVFSTINMPPSLCYHQFTAAEGGNGSESMRDVLPLYLQFL